LHNEQANKLKINIDEYEIVNKKLKEENIKVKEEIKENKKQIVNEFQNDEKLLAGMLYELGTMFIYSKKKQSNNILNEYAEEKHKKF